MDEQVKTDLDAAQKAIEALRGDGRPEIIRKAFEALLKVMKAFAERLADRLPHPDQGLPEPPTEPTEPTTKPV